MSSNESKNEMLVMVLTDLAGICKKVAEHSAVPEQLRAEADKLQEEFNWLSEHRHEGTAFQHFDGERLLVKIARFIPRVLEVRANPRSDVA